MGWLTAKGQIPGLHGFVREQAHAILGPMMYAPNVFTFDVDKFFAGELDICKLMTMYV